MKSKLIIILAALAALVLSGCSITGAAAKFKEFEALGLKEAEITGKFSSTTYKVEVRDGVRHAELDHTNAWLPKVRLVRETPAPEQK